MEGYSAVRNDGKAPFTRKRSWEPASEQRRVERAKKMKLDFNWEVEEEASQSISWEEFAPSGEVSNASIPTQDHRTIKQIGQKTVAHPSIEAGNGELYFAASESQLNQEINITPGQVEPRNTPEDPALLPCSDLYQAYWSVIQNWLNNHETVGISTEVIDLPEMSLQMLSNLRNQSCGAME